jgi:hypothetical protein
MSAIPFGTTDWSQIEQVKHPGERGFACWRTQQFGNIRVRTVEYSPGTEGELHTDLEDGRTFTLKPGMSHQVADNAKPHRSYTVLGARLFIVD